MLLRPTAPMRRSVSVGSSSSAGAVLLSSIAAPAEEQHALLPPAADAALPSGPPRPSAPPSELAAALSPHISLPSASSKEARRSEEGGAPGVSARPPVRGQRRPTVSTPPSEEEEEEEEEAAVIEAVAPAPPLSAACPSATGSSPSAAWPAAVPSSSGYRLKLCIRDGKGSRRELSVAPWQRVSEVKQQLAVLEFVRPGRQRLLYRGRELLNRRTLLECGVANGSQLLFCLKRPHSQSGSIEFFADSNSKAASALLADASRGLALGLRPDLAMDGTGGTYFLRGKSRRYVACFKPADEEPLAPLNPRGFVGRLGQTGLRSGVLSGGGFQREVAAYLLDHGRYAAVPVTARVEAVHATFNYSDVDRQAGQLPAKLGSLQAYVDADDLASDLAPKMFPVEDVHRVALLDMRIVNCDRNDANLLVRRLWDESGEHLSLTPIDHGYSLPSSLEIAWCDWCWYAWPQTAAPFSAATRDYIASLDVEADVEMLRELDITEPSLRLFRISSMLVQRGVAARLTLATLAAIMCRDDMAVPSPLEVTIELAKTMATAMMKNTRLKGSPEPAGSPPSSSYRTRHGRSSSFEEPASPAMHAEPAPQAGAAGAAAAPPDFSLPSAAVSAVPLARAMTAPEGDAAAAAPAMVGTPSPPASMPAAAPSLLSSLSSSAAGAAALFLPGASDGHGLTRSRTLYASMHETDTAPGSLLYGSSTLASLRPSRAADDSDSDSVASSASSSSSSSSSASSSSDLPRMSSFGLPAGAPKRVSAAPMLRLPESIVLSAGVSESKLSGSQHSFMPPRNLRTASLSGSSSSSLRRSPSSSAASGSGFGAFGISGSPSHSPSFHKVASYSSLTSLTHDESAGPATLDDDAFEDSRFTQYFWHYVEKLLDAEIEKQAKRSGVAGRASPAGGDAAPAGGGSAVAGGGSGVGGSGAAGDMFAGSMLPTSMSSVDVEFIDDDDDDDDDEPAFSSSPYDSSHLDDDDGGVIFVHPGDEEDTEGGVWM